MECKICQTKKTIDDFYKGMKSVCKKCHNSRCVKNNIKEMKRRCPACETILTYSLSSTFYRARSKNSLCKSCSRKGDKNPITKMMGEKHPFYGKTHTQKTKKKISIALQKYWKNDKVRETHSEMLKARYENSINHPMYGRNHSEATKTKISKSRRLRWILDQEDRKGQIYPNYNPDACKAIDEYGEKHGYNFQHAENGGEYHIKELGYWVDGYDKEKNVVIEYDEFHHFTKTGKLRKKDKIRQQEIEEHLECQFIRLKEAN